MAKILDVDFKNKKANFSFDTKDRDEQIVLMDKSFCNILENMQALGLHEEALKKIHDQFCHIAYYVITDTK